eukprot:g3218.t1
MRRLLGARTKQFLKRRPGPVRRGTISRFATRPFCWDPARAVNHLACRRVDGARARGQPPALRPRPFSSETLSKEEYVRVDPVEHVLLRPGMYVGATSPSNRVMWVAGRSEDDSAAGLSITPEKLSFTPALYKIFDEILANAADNAQRDMSMKNIAVEFDKGAGSISVFNDGTSIPVRMHETEGIYIPELVLGNLMTGSNFDDNVGRLTGGRHGFGAKLTNIFSKTFSIECADGPRGLLYRQTWHDNMRDRQDPVITPIDKGEANSYVRVSFVPEYSRFNLAGLQDDDTHRLMERRVVDVAGVNPRLNVTLNGETLKVDSFLSYMGMYGDKGDDPATVVYAKPNQRWEVGVTTSSDGDFEQFSFVNSLTTFRGGTHVQLVTDQIAKYLAQQINRQHGKGLDNTITANQVKSHMRVFVNCLIENPSFDSQTKEFLETSARAFGSTCSFSAKFMKDVYDSSGIVERVVSWAKAKQQVNFVSQMKSVNRSKLLNIPKLEDANDAGTKAALECSLILTEGDSAKALAVAGLSVVGRDKFGVFPLKGKMLNVRDASSAQILGNVEIKNIISILNLDMRKKYKGEDLADQGLRYGRIIIMADQDHDGSHIKGLLLNMIACFWPELLKKKDFISSFNTPIVKARKKGKGKGRQGEKKFFTIPAYNKWKAGLSPAELKQYAIKYYKGLGTSTADEARQYFNDLETHLVPFSAEDGSDFERLDMAFRSNRAADRKDWLLENAHRAAEQEAAPGKRVKPPSVFPVSSFVDEELVLFSHADNARSIGSAIDGLKPSQRKVLFACLKRNLTSEIKVAQLAGYVSEHAAYHHGEASLQSTITGMAQDYVGSNNIPLLYPSGQFGTRLQGGKDGASARYIFTRLQPVTRLIFPRADDQLLPCNDDDGYEVEPVTYVPIIPMALVNGIEGIGTGWSTSVPKYNPLDLIDCLVAKMDGLETPDLVPWVRGFEGQIRPKASSGKKKVYGFESLGCINRLNKTKIEINELPVGRWTEDQKALLVKLVGEKTIASFREHHTEEKVSFSVVLKRQQLRVLKEDDDLIRLFKLITPINLSNMHLFDAEGGIKKYQKPEDVIADYFPVRANLYEKRKANELGLLDVKRRTLENKTRFVQMVSTGELNLQNRSRDDMVAALSGEGFSTKSSLAVSSDAQLGSDDGMGWQEYEYLLKTPMWQLSVENVEGLVTEHAEVTSAFQDLEGTSPFRLWKNELADLSSFLSKDKLFGRKKKKKAKRKPRK